MKRTLFFGWLQRLDAYTGTNSGRKVALLIYRCSAHGTKHNLPGFDNVEVIFLPPNTTSKLQPLEA